MVELVGIMLALDKTQSRKGAYTSVATLSPNSHPAPRGETAHVSTSVPTFQVSDTIPTTPVPFFLQHTLWVTPY